MKKKYKTIVTGANGLLGQHMQATLLAHNGAASFAGEDERWLIEAVDRETFSNEARLVEIVSNADVIFHFAGINRADDHELEFGNIEIATQLNKALDHAESSAHVIYANSTHAQRDIPYGRGKKGAASVLGERAAKAESKFTNTLLPHIFGEGARPFYNNVTATLCHQITQAETPTINAGGSVELLHAGEVADRLIQIFLAGEAGEIQLNGIEISVDNLYEKLMNFKSAREKDLFPVISEKIDVALFQCLQTAGFPQSIHRELVQNIDDRGTLFETSKGGESGQTFLSWTHPGIERGNHFHRYKIERFVVLQGTAKIKLRHVLRDEVHVFNVDGKTPTAVDMPSLYSHSIVNTGDEPLLTLFWAHEIFNSEQPDTWACLVSGEHSHETLEYSSS